MSGSPFPRLTVFAQHAEAVRDLPPEPQPEVQVEAAVGIPQAPTIAYVDGPVAAPLAAAVVEDALRADEAQLHVVHEHHAEVERAAAQQRHVAHAQVVEVVAPAAVSIERPRPSHEALLDDGLDAEGLPHVEVEHLRARDVARELLRSRLLAIAERRERRSAWEIAFILLAAAVTVLLVTPPVVQILLAMHGVEA